MAVPHTFKRIVLHLARSPAFPSGSDQHGYDLVAPLDQEARIDAAAVAAHPDLARVRRFWPGEEDRIGRLIHRPGGPGGATWIFDYDERTTEDDEAGYRLADHTFRPGDYVSVRDDDGEMHTFRVISVENAA